MQDCKQWLYENMVNNQFEYISKMVFYLIERELSLSSVDVILRVCKYYHISVGDMVGKSRRNKEVVLARKVAFYMLDNEGLFINHTDIAHIMGRKNPSVVNYAIEQVFDNLPCNKYGVKKAISSIHKKL